MSLAEGPASGQTCPLISLFRADRLARIEQGRELAELRWSEHLRESGGEVDSCYTAVHRGSGNETTANRYTPAADPDSNVSRLEVCSFEASLRERRFSLQNGAGQLLPSERVSSCLRRPHGSAVTIVYHPGQGEGSKGSASYAGLHTCGSVWHCPVCAAKVAERRKEQLAAAVAEWESRGGRVLMVTYTLRHQAGEGLREVLAGLKAARKASRSGRAAVDFKGRYGVVGSIRALEVTYGASGWHPHLHELLFVDGGCDLSRLQSDLRSMWSAGCALAGRFANRHGLKVNFNHTAAEYLAKFGSDRTWGPEHELTRANSKKSLKGTNPIQLLSRWTWAQDVAAAALWIEYARTMKGQRQLFWSKGLSALLGLEQAEASTDEELAEEEQAKGLPLLMLNGCGWSRVVAMGSRGSLLDVASGGSYSAVVAFLEGLGVRPGLYFEPE